MSRLPAILAFAEAGPNEAESDSIYKYLSDTDFEESEVKSWGTIGSLLEALKEAENNPEPPKLGQEFIDFVSKLPPGTTPRPIVKKQIQRYIPV
ncbi:hypothetical protein TVAG_317270 [Trichomonas vaginalis G3]|uniref:Uncharacterized protein n=1 Tax=Trichomonas vaginalis (strain ATCC PRA-98 / G3) TaxID=412133 RepID=A2FR02_TRIV3|nr:hypothetical protein TVAGG3_0744400 [Trichomonas vaginalis G3]EAX92669.1 hypothetical protein TVAG_317270 [Trichomonas vaginalis G3]KAI5512062.1 hypothetical protein TVAGG3_0744400 [Trichomonas vaginalis G3]|eukprot:XP_001305599.1 hypothetical protein [Trichomonas vaginalis G3]